MHEGNQTTPYIPPNPFGVKPEYWERLQGMRLMDDALMRAALDNNIEATQRILRVILNNEDLRVIKSKAQVEYKNLFGHSLRVDIDAVDSRNVLYDIEIERNQYRAAPERLRFHAAVRDAHTLEESEDFKTLPTSYIIFITEEDRWKKRLPLYHVNRKIEETGEDFGDRCTFIYVNGSYEGNDAIGQLMADFRESNPDKMHFQELANRVRALKTSDEGVRTMCKAMEVTFNEGRAEGRIEGYVRSIRSLVRKQHVSVEEAMDILETPEKDRPTCMEYMRLHKEVA